MFTQDRHAMRQYYGQTWRKFQQGLGLDALEKQLVAVIQQHPEYHHYLNYDADSLDNDFSPENGATNPYLHMGLHLGLWEQITTDRPFGIKACYQQWLKLADAHDVEHKMMECLADSLWNAQKNNTMPDEMAYLACLKQLRM